MSNILPFKKKSVVDSLTLPIQFEILENGGVWTRIGENSWEQLSETSVVDQLLRIAQQNMEKDND